MLIQTFEYQKIKIGKKLSYLQWQALVAFAQKNGERYYKIVHDGIQFNHYVGILQVGDLTIEILPKIEETNPINVQHVLLDMLHECRLLQPESASIAALRERSGALLDIYILQFLQSVAQLLQEGLIKYYIPVKENRRVFKGKLLIHQQIIKNVAHPERFFTETFDYSYQHVFNQILYTALHILYAFPLRANVATYLQQLLHQFPTLEYWQKPLPDWDALRFNRPTLRYKNALQTAYLILQQSQPDVRFGQLPVLALLFDMNILFEEFIFRQLQKAANQNIIIKRQVTKPFWNRRPVQPDILLTIDNQNIVIDTKWKKLQKVSPSMEDLRQMYVYNQYFDAKNSVLVYPRVRGLEDLPPMPFQPTKENSEPYFCQVRLVDLVKDDKLNTSIGADLLKKIL